MIFKKVLFSALVLALLLPQALAQETLTLPQAIEKATANNPALKATRARLGITDAEIVTAGARRNPSIMSDNGIAEKTYRLGIEQTFRLGGKRQKQVSLAQAQRNVLLTEINMAILDLRADVRRAYARLFSAQQRLEVAENRVVINEQLVSAIQKRQNEGDTVEADLQKARVTVLRARNNVLVAQGEVVQARTALNLLLGQPLTTEWELTAPSLTTQPPSLMRNTTLETVSLSEPGSFQKADLEALVQEALARRPEIQQNMREITVTERQLDLAKANRIPDLMVVAGPDLVTGEETDLNAFIIASLPVPIFNRQQGPILEARARRTQLESQQAVVRNRIAADVINAYTDFTLNQERIRRFETEILPEAKNVLLLSQRNFEAGKISVLILLVVQQEYMEMRIEYLNALQDYQNAMSDLERAVGTAL